MRSKLTRSEGKSRPTTVYDRDLQTTIVFSNIIVISSYNNTILYWYNDDGDDDDDNSNNNNNNNETVLYNSVHNSPLFMRESETDNCGTINK